MELKELGWNSFFKEAFEKYEKDGLVPARVAVETKHNYLLFTELGEVPAIVPGKYLHKITDPSELPKVGDWVAASIKEGKDRALIQAVLPRVSRIIRKVAGKEHEPQVLAANVDIAFVVNSFDQKINPRRIERYLVMIHDGNVKPVIVFNKADLCENVDEALKEVREISGDTPIIVVSAKTGQGMDNLSKYIKSGSTVVFVGASGVGKSSLINYLYGEEIQATLEVRESDGKGRHTTTWREMIPLPGGGLVIDTPGMREFHLWTAEEGIEDAFPDIMEYGVNCKFRDCTHTVEKGCAVIDAVNKGLISRERFENYVKLRNELEYINKEIRIHTYMMKKRRKKPVIIDDSYEDDE